MIKAAILGTAHMHANEIALYISGQPETTLVGCADVPALRPEQTEKRYTRAWNLKNIATTYSVPIFDDYQTLLDQTKPDVAYILCENVRKPEVARACAARGVNIILEKPMAMSRAEAQKIQKLSEQFGIEVFVNWPVTWRTYLLQMKAAIDQGLCGSLTKLRYLNGHTGPLGKGAKHRGVSEKADEMTDEERAQTWWYWKACGGGAFLDILCYGCFFTRWMFGKMPEEVCAVGENLNTPFGDAEDNVAAIFRYPHAISVAEGTWTTPRRRMPTGPEAVCSDGVIWCDGVVDVAPTVCAADLYGEEVRVPELEVGRAFQNMPWQYAAHVLEGKPMHETLTLPFNLEVMTMLDAAIRASETHTVVRICAENSECAPLHPTNNDEGRMKK